MGAGRLTVSRELGDRWTRPRPVMFGLISLCSFTESLIAVMSSQRNRRLASCACRLLPSTLSVIRTRVERSTEGRSPHLTDGQDKAKTRGYCLGPISFFRSRVLAELAVNSGIFSFPQMLFFPWERVPAWPVIPLSSPSHWLIPSPWPALWFQHGRGIWPDCPVSISGSYLSKLASS